MPRRLLYTPQARDDLDALRQWQTQPGSGPAAIRRVKAIRDEIRRLKQFPCRHSVGKHRGVREMICSGGYVVLYDVVPDTGRNQTSGDVRVLRVFGPGQDRSQTP